MRRIILALLLLALARPAAAETSITLLGYSALFQERYTKAVVEPFMAAHPDIKVNYYPVPNSAQMLGMVRAQKGAPQADVAIMDLGVSKAGSDEGLFTPLAVADVPNIADLYPNARAPGLAGVAVTFDNLVLLYNTEKVTTAPSSWLDLANPAYAGKIDIPGMPDIVGLSLTVVLNKAMGGADYLQNVDAGIAELGKIAPNVQSWEPKPEVYAPIVAGQAVMGVGWNARAQLNADLSGGKIKGVLPKEGSLFQINTINLIAGAPQAGAAKSFINYALSPEAQKAFTEAMYYAPTNAKAKIAPGVISRTAVGSMDAMIPIDWVALAQSREKIGELWRRKVIPLSQ